MAKANSYTLRDGLEMLEAIVETDDKVMSPKARQEACIRMITNIRGQLPAEVAPMSEKKRQRIVGIAELYFEQMHPGTAKRAGRTIHKTARN